MTSTRRATTAPPHREKMISATGAHSHSHSRSSPRGAIDLDGRGSGRRLCMDSQKFLVPSLPVSTRLNNSGNGGSGSDLCNKKRERSIINGTAHTHSQGANDGHTHASSFQYQQPLSVNGMKRPYAHGHGQENGTSGANRFQGHTSKATGAHHPGLVGSRSPGKESPGMSSIYYQRSHGHNHTNGDLPLPQRAHHQMPSNPSNFHHLSRSSMPVPCSSPAAASSASPKAISPAINGSQHQQQHNQGPFTSQPSAHSHSHAHGDLSSLTSPLRFYPPGLPHPSHQMSFYAAAAAAAAAASGQHHALPYSLFPSPYAHAAAATSYLDNFHSSLLTQQQHQHHQQQQQQEHLKVAAAGLRSSPSPSPPTRPVSASSGFHSRSPLASPNISAAAMSLHPKYFGGSGPENGGFGHGHGHGSSLDNARSAALQNERDNLRFASMLCSGLSKGGPLGLSHGQIHLDNVNASFHHMNSFRQKEAGPSVGKPFTDRDERNSNANSNSISSKFWNIDPSLSTHAGVDGRNKRERATPGEREPPEGRMNMKKPGHNSNHNHNQPSEAFGSVNMMNIHAHGHNLSQGQNHNHPFMNGKEGSLKHRILTRSPDHVAVINSPIKHKMAETVFTFPDRSPNKLRETGAGSDSFLFPNPKKTSSYHEGLPPTMPRPPGPIATTMTTDSAKYLSQIQKPSINMSPSISSLESYLTQNCQNKSVQNLSSPLATAKGPVFNFTSPSQKSKSIPASPTTPTGKGANANGKVSALPLEQMPVIHAFRKGSLIQLAGGQLRPVEELRMEDFHRSAATMVDSLRIIHCRVVSIQASERKEDGLFRVTLAVGSTPQNQVVMSTSPVQPLFVVGRGWASCSPEMTEKVLQLPCTHLAVGDVCITLTKMSRTKPGRNGVKGGAGAKGAATKYKSSTNSILSTPPRRESAASTSYASKILKVSNGGIAKPSSLKSRGSLPLSPKTPNTPKSPTKVKFEQNPVPVVSVSVAAPVPAAVSTLASLLPPPTPVASVLASSASPENSQRTSFLKEENSNSSSKGVDLSMHVRESSDKNGKNDPPCPKKRRWSAPDVIKDAEAKAEAEAGTTTEVKHPKRPISHSPITTRLEI